MTDEAAEYEQDDELNRTHRANVWDFVAIGCAMISNVIGAFAAFWSQLAHVAVSHSNWRNEKKAFADSVRLDLERL